MHCAGLSSFENAPGAAPTRKIAILGSEASRSWGDVYDFAASNGIVNQHVPTYPGTVTKRPDPTRWLIVCYSITRAPNLAKSQFGEEMYFPRSAKSDVAAARQAQGRRCSVAKWF